MSFSVFVLSSAGRENQEVGITVKKSFCLYKRRRLHYVFLDGEKLKVMYFFLGWGAFEFGSICTNVGIVSVCIAIFPCFLWHFILTYPEESVHDCFFLFHSFVFGGR